MAEENKAIEWPGGANVADDFDFLMVGKDGQPIMKIPKEKLNEVIVINGEGIKAVAGGASSATPTILAPGPAGQNRKMEKVKGWFVNGTSAEPPVATGTPWEAPEGYDNTNWWDGTTWNLGGSLPLPTSPTTKKIEENNTLPPESDAVFKAVQTVQEEIVSKTSAAYLGSRAYRFYTANDTYVNSRVQVEQENYNDKDTFKHNFSSASTGALYFDTGVQVDPNLTGFVVFEITIKEFIYSGNNAFGFGWGNSTVYQGAVYRNRLELNPQIGDVLLLNPYSSSGLGSLFPTGSIGDVFRFEVSVKNSDVSIYKNNVFVVKLALPNIQTNTGTTWQVVLRGGLAVEVKKIYTKVYNFAPNSVLETVSTINSNYPFLKSSTFVSDYPQSSGQDRKFIKDAVKDIKLYGADVNKKYSVYAIFRNSTNTWRIDVYEDTGSGNGVTKSLFSQWLKVGYTEPSGIDVIDNVVNGVGFKIYIDWSQVPTGSNGGITYNAAGLDVKTLINFNSSSVEPQPDEYYLSWQYNNVDAPTTGTSLFSQFTLVPNVDDDGDTLGCTGASYNKDTEEYVISYYSFAKASKLWFFKRKDLINYSPEGTIVPKPSREIDVSQYLYHIQGNVYDPETKSYWVLGSLNSVSTDTERILIRVDDEGNQLERHILSDYSFQAGMIALSPDLKNILIKPNNRTWLLELSKNDLSLVRQVNGVTNNEGLGVDYKNGFVWLGNDAGNLFKYSYNNMTLLDTIPYQSLPNPNGSQNIEGLIVDVDGALINVADAFLHGANNNGNCMWVYDFSKTINKYIHFPEMLRLNAKNESPIIDFNGYSSSIKKATVNKGTGIIQYRGSDSIPTSLLISRKNWRELPYFIDWGQTQPGEWSQEIPNTRYIQLRII